MHLLKSSVVEAVLALPDYFPIQQKARPVSCTVYYFYFVKRPSFILASMQLNFNT